MRVVGSAAIVMGLSAVVKWRAVVSAERILGLH